MIYYKQEKYNLAEVHFKKALNINPSSSVLLCHIGVVSIEFLNSLRLWCLVLFYSILFSLFL